MHKVKHILIVLFIFSLMVCCGSWGFLVHKTITQLAVYKLKGNLRAFFYSNMDSIVQHSIRPDLRRNYDSTEDTKHFIDLEAYGDSAAWKMPHHWDDAVRLYTKDTLLKYGYVPYHVITMKNRLTNAFRSGNKDSILFYAEDIAHYIGDAHVPLHTSINYDGQLSGQKGLHSLWESVIPEIELDQYNLYSNHKAGYLAKPEEAIWQAVRQAHTLLPDVFAKEKEASAFFTDSTKYRIQKRNGRESKVYTQEFAKAYSRLLGKTINQQLINASNLIADFWYTSWVDAGRPDLSSFTANSYNKKLLKKEYKAYRKNKLREKNLLVARKTTASSN